jgi:hypothetical protein
MCLITFLAVMFPWVLFSLVLFLLAVIIFYRLKRWIALRFDGYHIAHSRTMNYRCIYEERFGREIKSIPLETINFEPGRDFVVVPTRENWNFQAPDWAKNRRDEILGRVIKKRVPYEFPQDWQR